MPRTSRYIGMARRTYPKRKCHGQFNRQDGRWNDSRPWPEKISRSGLYYTGRCPLRWLKGPAVVFKSRKVDADLAGLVVLGTAPVGGGGKLVDGSLVLPMVVKGKTLPKDKLYELNYGN